LRLFITPLHSVIRALIAGLKLGARYDFWLKELVRINEEEAARAGARPFALWDFSAPSQITRERIPEMGDPSPMKWYWEHSHYRKETGDLILDKVLEFKKKGAPDFSDFGTRITSVNVQSHIDKANKEIDRWNIEDELGAKIIEGTKDPRARNRQREAKCW
jgi:hypothetical protein